MITRPASAWPSLQHERQQCFQAVYFLCQFLVILQWQNQVCSFIFLIIKQRLSATMKVRRRSIPQAEPKNAAVVFVLFQVFICVNMAAE
jgi:hypothetical protein